MAALLLEMTTSSAPSWSASSSFFDESVTNCGGSSRTLPAHISLARTTLAPLSREAVRRAEWPWGHPAVIPATAPFSTDSATCQACVKEVYCVVFGV
jgi:hypothetical protein